MTTPALSPDQADAWDALAEVLAASGVDLVAEELSPPTEGKGRVMAVLGKAGSGKTLLLAELTRALVAAGFQVERHRGAIGQIADARTLQRADVQEHIAIATLRCDKAEAFGSVEPFHGAFGHRDIPSD